MAELLNEACKHSDYDTVVKIFSERSDEIPNDFNPLFSVAFSVRITMNAIGHFVTGQYIHSITKEERIQKHQKWLSFFEDTKKILNLLFDKGYNVNDQDKYGNTILHLLCNNIDLKEFYRDKYAELIEIIKEQNADLTIKNIDGKTPYDLVSRLYLKDIAAIVKV